MGFDAFLATNPLAGCAVRLKQRKAAHEDCFLVLRLHGVAIIPPVMMMSRNRNDWSAITAEKQYSVRIDWKLSD